MIIRRSNERGKGELGWLQSKHTFSFGEYFDRKHMHFHSLRVINEDIIEAAGGFPTHPHKDMEIVTLVLSGQLAHRDSLGHEEVLKPGEVQVMTAGSGLTHSEFNPSDTTPAHIMQIWIMPEEKGLTPRYEQRDFSSHDRNNKWLQVAGRVGVEDLTVLHINQDAAIYLSKIERGNALEYNLADERCAWIHLISGKASVYDEKLQCGDALGVEASGSVSFSTENSEGAEFILFDLARLE